MKILHLIKQHRFYLVCTIITLCIAIGWFIFCPTNKPKTEPKDVLLIGERVHKTIIPQLLNNRFHRTGIFLYSKDFSRRTFLASSSSMNISDKFITWKTKGDPTFEKAIKFHKQKECLVEMSTDLPDHSLMRQAIRDWQYIDIADNVFYMSCPLYVRNYLIGYVATVTISTFPLPDYQTLKVLSKEIEKELAPLF